MDDFVHDVGDGRQAMSAAGDGTVRHWDLETGAVKTYDKPAGELSSQIDISAF